MKIRDFPQESKGDKYMKDELSGSEVTWIVCFQCAKIAYMREERDRGGGREMRPAIKIYSKHSISFSSKNCALRHL